MRRRFSVLARKLSLGQLRPPGWLSVLALCAGLLGSAIASAEEVPPLANVNDARIVGDATRTRFVADLSKTVAISVFTLADPYRIVIDLPELHFEMDAGSGQAGRGLISAFRYGLISDGKSRIVLDMTGPVKVDKAFVIDPAGSQPARLVVDVVQATRQEFLAAYEKEAQARAAESLRDERAAAQQGRPHDGRPRIVLDPGHGGIDSGAVGIGKTLEKNVVLTFAKELAAALDESGEFDVVLTRDDDSFVRLSERIAVARRNQADLLVSIHADSFRGKGVRGATVYTLSEQASNEMAAQLAETENRSDLMAGLEIEDEPTEVADILLDLARRETKNFSIGFARDVIRELRPAVQLFKNPHQQASFAVLQAPDVPSILLELGYLSNAEDEKLLTSEDWRKKAAGAVASAIESYFRTHLAREAMR